MAGKRILCITADGFEDTELLCPVHRLLEEGHAVDIVAPGKAEITGKKGYTVQPDLSLDELPKDPGTEYDGLLLPGGKAPAALRRIDAVVEAAKGFAESDKPIAAICHGPQILVTAGLLQGKRATSYTSVAKELKEAGAEYLDQEVVVEGSFIFSRNPQDLPAFNRELIRMLA